MDRKPLANRVPSNRSASLSKRPRSPDILLDPSGLRSSSKRVRPTPPATRSSTKDRKHAEREQQKAEFKDKFTRAFPTFTFCFDIDNVGPVDALVSMIRQLGGV